MDSFRSTGDIWIWTECLLGPCYSKRGQWTSGLSNIGSLVDLQVSKLDVQTYWIRVCIFLRGPAGDCYGLTCVSTSPPPFVCWSPNPQDLRMWSYLETGSLQISLVKTKVIRMGPHLICPVSLCKGNFGHRECTQGEGHVKMKTNREGMLSTFQGMPKSFSRPPRKLEERHGTDSSSQPRKEPTLMNTLILNL